MKQFYLTILIIVLVCATSYSQNLEIEGNATISNSVVIGSSTTNKKFEVLVDSTFILPTFNDQSSIATGDPLVISSGSYGAQSFIAGISGGLAAIEIFGKKEGASDSDLNLQIRTGSNPASGVVRANIPFTITSAVDAIYNIQISPTIPLTMNSDYVIIIEKTGGGDATWQRSITDVYPNGNAFLNASGWLPPLLSKDHWFKSYVFETVVSPVSLLSIGDDRKIKFGDIQDDNSADNVLVIKPDGTIAKKSQSNLQNLEEVNELEAQILELQILLGLKVQDIDNNVYDAVEIGTQIWMAENLRVTKYNDGTPLLEEQDNTAWGNLTTPAYCWYENDSQTYSISYGALYNYYVVADTNSLNVCPTGWHIPSDSEWDVLRDFLDPSASGNTNIAGGKMKSTGTIQAGTGLWNAPNTGATNESGFTGLPGGVRYDGGIFNFIDLYGHWWSSTENNMTNAWYHYLDYSADNLFRALNNKGTGLSVRCLKD